MKGGRDMGDLITMSNRELTRAEVCQRLINLLRNKGAQGKVCHEKINYEPL